MRHRRAARSAIRRSSPARPCHRTRAGRPGWSTGRTLAAARHGSGARSAGRGSLGTLDEPLEAIQPTLPGAAVGLDPLAGLAEGGDRAQPALARPAHLLGLDQARELEDPDVLLDA